MRKRDRERHNGINRARRPFRNIGFLGKLNYDSETGCWNWPLNGRHSQGYGIAHFKGKRIRAHRLAAILWLKMPEDCSLDVLHKCDNPSCFNPKHLYLGTDKENMRDVVLHGRHFFGQRTHCKNGHPLDEKNAAPRFDHPGRRCKRCDVIRSLKYQAKEKVQEEVP